jgi:hypothetical protein
VIFIRYSPDRKPTVSEIEDGLEVNVFDPILQRDLGITADFVNLATAIEPADNDEIASFYKLPSCGRLILHRMGCLSVDWPTIRNLSMKTLPRPWLLQAGRPQSFQSRPSLFLRLYPR